MYEFKGKEKNPVIIFEKQDEGYSLKFYFQECQAPNFEKNFGYDRISYTRKNLLIITFDHKNGLRVRTDENTESRLQLDPFSVDIETPCPFESASQFAIFFWQSYQHMMKREIMELEEKG